MKYTEAQCLEAIAFAKRMGIQGRIVRCFAIAMLNYRQPLGDKALDAIHEVMDQECVSALMFLTGICMGSPQISEEQWAKLGGIVE